MRVTIADMRFALLLACLAAAAPAMADAAAEVRCREIAFSRAAEARDLDAFRSFIDRDARFVGDDVLRGVDAVAEAWAEFFEPGGPLIRWRPRLVEVLDDGRLALSTGPYRIIARDTHGVPTEYWGTFNSVWRRSDDGTWRIVIDAGSPLESPPDEATRALLSAVDSCE